MCLPAVVHCSSLDFESYCLDKQYLAQPESISYLCKAYLGDSKLYPIISAIQKSAVEFAKINNTNQFKNYLESVYIGYKILDPDKKSIIIFLILNSYESFDFNEMLSSIPSLKKENNAYKIADGVYVFLCSKNSVMISNRQLDKKYISSFYSITEQKFSKIKKNPEIIENIYALNTTSIQKKINDLLNSYLNTFSLLSKTIIHCQNFEIETFKNNVMNIKIEFADNKSFNENYEVILGHKEIIQIFLTAFLENLKSSDSLKLPVNSSNELVNILQDAIDVIDNIKIELTQKSIIFKNISGINKVTTNLQQYLKN